jgi:lipoprotein-releasing system permease protein
MSFLLILDIAKTLLLARVKQSVVAATGVTFGIGMFISLMGFMQGFNQLLDDLVLNRTPHILLYNEVEANISQPIRLSAEHREDYHRIRSIKPKVAGLEIRNSLAILNSLR